MADCKRHRYETTQAWPIEKKSAGSGSGYWGMWEMRTCKCGATTGRYAPTINERSAAAAQRAYRLVSRR